MSVPVEKKLELLNEDQRKVHDAVVNGRHNVFFTGDAGTGKSFLLECIVHSLKENGMAKRRIAITASTGKAAYGISGCTLHSFAGVGLGELPASDYIMRINRSKASKAKERWKATSVLIIDEISMIDGDFFTKLEAIARGVLRNNEPFGGIQLVIVGDFMQLCPVSTEDEPKKFAFESEAWPKCIKKGNYYLLHKIHRQSDEEFINVLRSIRVGIVDEEVTRFMERLATPKVYEEDQNVTHIYALRSLADGHNAQELDMIEGDSVKIHAIDVVDKNSTKQLAQCPAPQVLELKIGAQVMLIKNLTRSLVNGTVGVVTDIIDAMSGKTIQQKEIVTDAIPIVKFTMLDGRAFKRPLAREEWKTETSEGKLISSRKQVPLILAWATTIHKSQGQTIQRLKVDLNNIFEHGQTYTALSRAVNPDGLEVTGFTENCVSASKTAAEFCIEHNLI